jgi:cysteine synthase
MSYGNGVNTILETASGAPTVKLSRVAPAGVQVMLKPEHLSPNSALADRIAAALLHQARADGRLRPGEAFVEAVSANVGVGLAMTARHFGHRFTAVVLDDAPRDLFRLIRIYGAGLVTIPAADGFENAAVRAQTLADEAGAKCLGLHRDPTGIECHRQGLMGELAETLRGAPVQAFVSTAWSGAVLAAACALRGELSLQVIGAEVDAPLHGSGKLAAAALLKGISLDASVQVGAARALEMKERLAREEGLLVGPVTGANVVAAVDYTTRSGVKSVLTLSVDSGERA